MTAMLAWRPVETAPTDGTLLRLLVEHEDHGHPLEDSDRPTPTIGFNNHDNDGEHTWQMAGWCWSHDHFTEGRGEVVGWLPFEDVAQDTLDLMRDEFQRINALQPGPEIEALCNRAVSDIERNVPLILDLESTRRDLENLRARFEIVRKVEGHQEAEIAALREALKSEADYCYGWAKHYAATNPERAARHRERGDRLSAALQGEQGGG